MISWSKPAPTSVQSILLHCCSLPDGESRVRLRKLLDALQDWDALVTVADERHRLAPMLLRHLQDGCEDLVPARVLEGLKASHRHNVTMSLQLVATLIQVGENLSRAQIPWICFKGPVLAQVLYGDLGLRHAIDVDLLVPENRFSEVDSLLLSHGLVPRTPESRQDDLVSSLHFYNLEKRLQVDVHWRLFRPYYGMNFQFQALWNRKQLVKVGGRALNTLHPLDRLVVLGVHGSKHFWNHFKWLCDFHLAVNQCRPDDWPAILVRCRTLEAETLFVPALWTLHHLLGVRFPASVRTFLQESPRLVRLGQRLAEEALSVGKPVSGSLSGALLKLRLIPSTRHRVRYLADGVWRRIRGKGF